MADEQDNKQFYKTADSFIDVANNHCENQESTRVGSALLFATARFSSFVVASQSKDEESYEAEIDNALEFFSSEFKRMLKQNLEDYKSAFKAREDAPKYEHLIKK
jgi:HD-like signal output (HDOD) protein